jgi:hypothetical protein
MTKQLSLAILVGSISLSLVLQGCATVKLYPIAKTDIVLMQKGIAYTPDRDGFFLSTMYMNEVLRAKVEKENLK